MCAGCRCARSGRRSVRRSRCGPPHQAPSAALPCAWSACCTGGRPCAAAPMLPPVKALALEGTTARPEDVVGRILVHDLGSDLRKGTVLTEKHMDRVRQVASLHVVELEPGDVHEDVAARRLAAALAGPGLEARPPVQSQARLVSARRGLVRVQPQLVDAINSLGYVSLFTLMDGQAVTAGEEVAGCKVTPVAVPGHLVEAAETIAREKGPVVELLAFRPLRTFVVATERLKPKA